MTFGQEVCTTVKWYAWFPVKDEKGIYHWLEYVDRTKDRFWGKEFYIYNKENLA